MKWTLMVLVSLAAVLSGCHTPPSGPAIGSAPEAESAAAVRAVLDRQAADWNAGNLAGFMEGYAKSAKTRFASGGDVHLGWETVFERYRRRYGDRAAMGHLTFSGVEISVLSTDAALAFGQWHLQRAADEPHGLFTLLFRRTPEGWKVVHDHTSAAETKS